MPPLEPWILLNNCPICEANPAVPVPPVEASPGIRDSAGLSVTAQASSVVLRDCTWTARAGLIEFTPADRSIAAFTDAVSPTTAIVVPRKAIERVAFGFELVMSVAPP